MKLMKAHEKKLKNYFKKINLIKLSVLKSSLKFFSSVIKFFLNNLKLIFFITFFLISNP